MKNEKGLTLVALVVTIIVLIILAGISINLLMGDNGIITKAQDAARIAKEAQVKEEVSLAITTLKMSQLAGRAQNDIVTKQELNSHLKNGTIMQEPTKSDNGYILKYKEDDTIYTINVEDNGKLKVLDSDKSGILKISAAEVKVSPTTYYGKTVNYSANDTTDWKIFYSDGTHIFLIKSDYLENTKIPSNTVMTKNGTYNAYWGAFPEVITDRQDELFMAKGFNLNSNLPNSKCAGRLLTPSIWNSFVDTTYADYAIGGPTIEMYVASWNDMYKNEKLECTPNSLEPNQDSKGYKVCIQGETPANYIAKEVMQLKAGFNNILYYPHPSVLNERYDGCGGYWLASPNSAIGDYRLLTIHCSGSINSEDMTINYYSVRPLVALKVDARLTEGTNGYDYNLILK